MSKSAFTVKVFGVYVFTLGLVLLVLPNTLLALFGIPETTEVWIRVLGVIVVNLGVTYWYAAKSEATPLFIASIFTRMFVFVAFIVLVLMGYSKPVLILFGTIDLTGGIWTFLALKGERNITKI